MQRRFSTIFILSLLLLAFGAMTAFAANAPVQKKVVDLKVDKSVYYSFPDEYDFQFGTSSDRPLRSSTYGNSASAASPGVSVGDTWYDYQHNGTIGRMVTWGPYTIDGSGVVIHDAGSAADPGVHFSWMGLPGPVMQSRAYYYNYYNAATGLFSPTGPIPVQPTDEYAGYVGVDVTPSDNKAVMIGHNNQGSGYQTHIYWDFDAMFGFFSANNRVEDTVAAYGSSNDPNAVIWPKAKYQVGTQTVTHVIAQVSEPNAADPQSIYYFRKVGTEDGGVWDYPPYVIDTIYDLSHDIAAEPLGDKVALVWTANLPQGADIGTCDTCSGESSIHVQWDNDIYYQISNDQGSNWLPRVNVTQNVNGEAGFRPYTDLSSLIDSDGNLHIVWSAVVWPADPVSDGWGWNCRVFHWSEDNPYVRTVHSADFTQTVCTPGAWNINAAKMQVSECDGKIYVMWVQFNDPETHLDDCHARAAGGTGDFQGAANGELYFAISGDNGLTWDKARNLTNSYTPLCEPENGGIDCANDNWPSMAPYGRQDQAGDDWSGAVVVDPSGGSYAGDMYLDIQYVNDVDAGGIVQEEGTWQLGTMNWFRMACVEPIPNPLPVITPAEIDEPVWTKPSVQRDEDIVIENAGNVALTYTVVVDEGTGPSGWLGTSGLSGSVPSGLSNIETGQILLNQGGVQTTDAILEGRIVIDHNGPTDTTVIPIRLLVADTLVGLVYDTLYTGCLALSVGTNGSFGQAGPGNVNLDWDYSGADCDTTAEVYLYDGAPVILWEAEWDSTAGTDTVYHSSIFQTSYLTNTRDGANGVNGFRPIVTDRCVKAEANMNRIVSGAFVTQDSTIAMQKFWYGPTDADSCDFVIQCLKVWSHDGAAHSGLRIGEAVDWDIPSDSGAENKSGFDFARNLIYQYGAEYHQDDTGANAACQDSDVRFGGVAFIESYLNGAIHQTAPYSAYTHENDTMVFPTGNFRPQELYENMDASGFSVSDSTEDLHTVMCFEPSLSLGATDTLEFYVIYASVMDAGASASPAALQAVVDKANAWYTQNFANLLKSCGCCDGNTGDVDGNGSDDISDLLFLVDYQFVPGAPAPPCIEEADVNCSGAVDISDLLYLVDYQFVPGSPAPCACP